MPQDIHTSHTRRFFSYHPQISAAAADTPLFPCTRGIVRGRERIRFNVRPSAPASTCFALANIKFVATGPQEEGHAEGCEVLTRARRKVLCRLFLYLICRLRQP